MVDDDRNLVLTGFMGTGKSTIAGMVAERLGRPWVDMDSILAERAGMPVSDIFAREGEVEFRRREAALASELSRQHRLVIATGGGALLDAATARQMAASGVVICLDAAPDVLYSRLHDACDRPLLNAEDRAGRITSLWKERRPLYARLPLHIDTTRLSCEQVVEKVCALYGAAPRTLPVNTPDGGYYVLVMPGAAMALGDLFKAYDISQHIVVVSNEKVWPLYGEAISEQIADFGFQPCVVLVPDGEKYKTLETVQMIYNRCAEAGLDRHSALIALGGGVVTDMAGFAAATYLRGIPFIPLPTSLLAMVDASVGGKVAVDLPKGKNLVGAFSQPLQVFIDPNYLETLPASELDCGLVEIIKAGIIGDPELFAALEAGSRVQNWRWLIERALAVKIAIVEEDPYESGNRAVLNLGHTFAHAFEVLSNYQFSHGRAVAIGLVAASELAVIRGHLDQATSRRIRQLLEHFGLPTSWTYTTAEDVIQAMQQDKKRIDGRLRFVLPQAIGRVVIDDTVSTAEIEQALERIYAP